MKINPKPLISLIGTKAYYLYVLKKFCNVPDFFVITFDNSKELKDLRNQKKILAFNKFDFMSVRSSSNFEDLSRLSFAGMFKTVLGVNNEGLLEAISVVLDSVNNQRVIKYCEINNINPNEIKMSVIIQRMLQSRVSGVCFTKSKNPNELIVEACQGLGEGLVSGKVTPDTYILDRNTLEIVRSSIGYQREMLVFEKKLLYQEIPFYKRNSKKLDKGELIKVSRTCLEIEKKLGFLSADVEWAIQDDQQYILQVRPYTGNITE